MFPNGSKSGVLGTSFFCAVSSVGSPDVKLKSLASEGKYPLFCDPSQVWTTIARVYNFLWQDHTSALTNHQCCNFYPFTFQWTVETHSVFKFFSERIIPYVSLYLLCPWEDVNSGSSHTALSWTLKSSENI